MATNLNQTSSMKLQKLSPIMMGTKTSCEVLVATYTTPRKRRSMSIVFMRMFFWICDYKIFNSVIQFITIQVMYYLLWFKIAFQIFLHNKTMFKNITITLSKRVVGYTYQAITTGGYITTTFPVIMPVARRHIIKVALSTITGFRPTFHVGHGGIFNKFATFFTFFVNHNLIIRKGYYVVN